MRPAAVAGGRVSVESWGTGRRGFCRAIVGLPDILGPHLGVASSSSFNSASWQGWMVSSLSTYMS